MRGGWAVRSALDSSLCERIMRGRGRQDFGVAVLLYFD
jgi:hypothetical protein